MGVLITIDLHVTKEGWQPVECSVKRGMTPNKWGSEQTTGQGEEGIINFSLCHKEEESPQKAKWEGKKKKTTVDCSEGGGKRRNESGRGGKRLEFMFFTMFLGKRRKRVWGPSGPDHGSGQEKKNQGRQRGGKKNPVAKGGERMLDLRLGGEGGPVL